MIDHTVAEPLPPITLRMIKETMAALPSRPPKELKLFLGERYRPAKDLIQGWFPGIKIVFVKALKTRDGIIAKKGAIERIVKL